MKQSTGIAIIATTVAALAYDVRIAFRLKKKATEILDENISLRKDLADYQTEVDHLVHLLNKHKVPIDEFDLIVMPHITRK